MTQNELFSIPVLTVLIGGIVTIIGAAAAAVVTIINAFRAELTNVGKSVAKIEGHVNSEKTAAEGREVALTLEIDLLREINANQKQAAALLAQAAAGRTREVSSVESPPTLT